jgi:hypothetical protein
VWSVQTLLDDVARSSVVSDRELDEEKSREPSDPRIRCPLCGWSPRNDDLWVLHLRARMEHVRYGRSVPRLPAPMDFNAVSLVRPLVGAFRLVYEVIGASLDRKRVELQSERTGIERLMPAISTTAVASQHERPAPIADDIPAICAISVVAGISKANLGSLRGSAPDDTRRGIIVLSGRCATLHNSSCN